MVRHPKLWWTWGISTALATIYGVGNIAIEFAANGVEDAMAPPAMGEMFGTIDFPSLHHYLAAALLLASIIGARFLWRRGRTVAGCYAAWIPMLLVILMAVELSFGAFHSPIPTFWARASLWILAPVGLLLHPPVEFLLDRQPPADDRPDGN